jgi:hypothetical protein
MADGHASVRIRSFRLVMRIERRLHRVGPWQIPLPYGLPLAAVLYAGAAVLALLVLGRLPLLGALLGALPAPVRLALLPAAIAWALCRFRPDGRPLLRVGASWARRRLEPRRIAAFRAAPRTGRLVRLADLAIASEGHGPALMRASLGVPRLGAPVSFTLRYPCAAWSRGRTLYLRQLPGAARWRGTTVTLRPGQRVVFEGEERS